MLDTSKLTPVNHHLIFAYYSWFVENGSKIHLTVNGERLPDNNFLQRYRNELNRIAVSVGTNAVRDFIVDNHGVSFDATFSGTHRTVYLPINAIEAITGWFPGQDESPVRIILPELPDTENKDAVPEEKPTKSRPRLKVVK